MDRLSEKAQSSLAAFSLPKAVTAAILSAAMWASPIQSSTILDVQPILRQDVPVVCPSC